MRIVLLTTLLTTLTVPSMCHALEYDLVGVIDPLQAESNGGFGSFDSSVSGAGDGTGTLAGTYDDVTNLLNYSVTWQNLSSDVTNMHFHRGAAGVSGGVDLGVPGPWSSPQNGTDVAVSDAAEENLLNGDWYLNIHTSNFGGGEIRGQVMVTPVPEPATCTMLGVAMFALAFLARRNR